MHIVFCQPLMFMSGLLQTWAPVITPPWLNKTTAHPHTHQTSVLSISLTYCSVWKVSGSKFHPLKQGDDWNVSLYGMASEGFPADFTFHYYLFWLVLFTQNFCQYEQSSSNTCVCVSGVRAVWTCCLFVAQVTVCSVTLLSERVISVCSFLKIQPSIKRWRSARRFLKCMWVYYHVCIQRGDLYNMFWICFLSSFISYNKREFDFASLKEYNDYLEQVEDIGEIYLSIYIFMSDF